MRLWNRSTTSTRPTDTAVATSHAGIENGRSRALGTVASALGTTFDSRCTVDRCVSVRKERQNCKHGLHDCSGKCRWGGGLVVFF